MMESKSVTIRMPVDLYKKIRDISDREFMTVSAVIFNILDKVLTEKTNALNFLLEGVSDEDVFQEIKTTNEPAIRELLQRLLSDSEFVRPEPGSDERSVDDGYGSADGDCSQLR